MTRPALVMKFGGTSVGSAGMIARVAALIADQARDRPVAVVLSAMARVTNWILGMLDAAAGGDAGSVDRGMRRIRELHFAAADELLPGPQAQAAKGRMERMLRRLDRTARGMLLLREQPERAIDAVAATGEQLSTCLLSEVLRLQGCAARRVSGTELIVTDSAFGGASPLFDKTAARAETVLKPILDEGVVPVITGFNGTTKDGQATTLGRGGSDYSAAIIANVLAAEELWIWTDVDGILSCDPRIASDARLLEEVTYNEAAELSYNGAKVLHPRTLAPLAQLGIPVRIKNTFQPELSGTRIWNRPVERRGVRAITSLSKVSLISIEAAGITRSGPQLMARALAAAARARVEVLLLSRSSFRQNFCMLVHERDVEAVLENLREELSLELAHEYVLPISVDSSVGLLAAVGEGMRGTPGLAGRLFTAISRENVNIIAIAQGSSELTIAIVVNEQDLRVAVSAIHSLCELGRPAAMTA